MIDIILRLKASELENPDLDIRYQLPDRIVASSDGRIKDNGYDYGNDPDELYLFLKAVDASDVSFAITVVQNDTFCGNHLHNCVVVAIEEAGKINIMYPQDYVGDFNVPSAS